MTGYMRLNKIKILFNRVEADGFSEGKIEIADSFRAPLTRTDQSRIELDTFFEISVCRYHI